MSITNEIRRRVMHTAWALYREGRQLRDGRTFSDSLRWAWREVRHGLAKAARSAMQLVRLSPSLIRSPVQNLSRTRRYGRGLDYRAAYLSSRLGC